MDFGLTWTLDFGFLEKVSILDKLGFWILDFWKQEWILDFGSTWILDFGFLKTRLDFGLSWILDFWKQDWILD